jgi:hypothetical protein
MLYLITSNNQPMYHRTNCDGSLNTNLKFPYNFDFGMREIFMGEAKGYYFEDLKDTLLLMRQYQKLPKKDRVVLEIHEVQSKSINDLITSEETILIYFTIDSIIQLTPRAMIRLGINYPQFLLDEDYEYLGES